MRRDQTILLVLAVAAVLFASGDACDDSGALIGGSGPVSQGLLGLPLVVDVCRPNIAPIASYKRQPYFLGPGGWMTAGPSEVEYGTAPDDCIHSGDFSGQENPASSWATMMQTMTGPSAKARANASSQAPEYPAGDQPAYFKNLPVPPAFSMAVWNGLTPHCDPNQSYYTINHGNGTVTHFGACPLHKIVALPVVSNPLAAVLSPDARLLLVTSFNGALNFIDTSTDQVTFTLSTQGFNPSGLAISPDGTRAYVTNYTANGSLLFVDIAGRKVTGSIPLPPYPRNLFLTPDGSQLWVNYLASNTISIIDTLTNSVASTLVVNGTAAEAGMAFNPTGTRAYIAVRPGTLAVVDTATLNTVANVTVGSWPVDVLVTQDGGRILVDDFSSKGTLTAINAATNTVIGSLDTGAPATGMVLYPQIP